MIDITCPVCRQPWEAAQQLAPPAHWKAPHLASAFWNLRAVAEELVLLEQHLGRVDARCPQCIMKHFLACEALSKEAARLDDGKHLAKLLGHVLREIWKIEMSWIDGASDLEIGQAVRTIRRAIVPIVFDPRGPKGEGA